MFRHHHAHGPFRGHFARGPFGFHGLHGHHHRHREGSRGGRFFDHGDLRFVILKLVAEQPRHGYELIKAVEQAVGGAYSPSPGVIYPTLTLLEELGYAEAAEASGAKKLYAATDAGRAFLEENAAHVAALFQRMADAAARAPDLHPQIVRARENLGLALKLKLSASRLTPEQVEAVRKVLDDAAAAIERV